MVGKRWGHVSFRVRNCRVLVHPFGCFARFLKHQLYHYHHSVYIDELILIIIIVDVRFPNKMTQSANVLGISPKQCSMVCGNHVSWLLFFCIILLMVQKSCTTWCVGYLPLFTRFIYARWWSPDFWTINRIMGSQEERLVQAPQVWGFAQGLPGRNCLKFSALLKGFPGAENNPLNEVLFNKGIWAGVGWAS